MFKSVASFGITIALAVASSAAGASGYYGHGYRSSGIFYGSGFTGHYGNNYTRGFYNHGYRGHGYGSGFRVGYGSHGYKHGYGHGYSHGSNNGWYFLGGVLLGSLLTHSYNSSRYTSTYASYPSTTHYQPAYYQPARVVEKRVVYHAPTVDTRVAEPRARSMRRLHRDLEGRCFEIRFNDAGDELRTELPESECDWG